MLQAEIELIIKRIEEAVIEQRRVNIGNNHQFVFEEQEHSLRVTILSIKEHSFRDNEKATMSSFIFYFGVCWYSDNHSISFVITNVNIDKNEITTTYEAIFTKE